jgi:hypothetical protein
MIQLRMNPEKNVVAAIEFSGKDMEEFFRAYSALSSTREQIGDLYKTVIFALMQKYEICFMPGAKVNYVVPSVELNDLQKSMVDGGETVRINLGAPLS